MSGVRKGILAVLLVLSGAAASGFDWPVSEPLVLSTFASGGSR